jgi:Xaa-Pro aminopeptidase
MTARSQSAASATEASRLPRRLFDLLAEQRQQVFLISAAPNIRYLTGFTGSSGYLLVSPGRTVLYTDGRYETQAREQTRGLEIVISLRNPLLSVEQGLKKQGIKTLAFEENRLSFETYQRLAALPKLSLKPLAGLVEELRAVKSEAEIALIRRSAALNSEAYDRACARVRPSWTELRLAGEIEYQMRRLGAEKAAFDTIVAGGPRAALPHATPSRAPLARNSLIVIDQGAILDGYNSDMTRMACLGRLASREREWVQAVWEAQQAAIDKVKAGVRAGAVDRAARQVLKRFGLAAAFKHSTGHGLGLEIHEQPRIGPAEAMRLTAGMVITIEPGVYIEGAGGVRIEDVVAVTQNGCEVLTPASKPVRFL